MSGMCDDNVCKIVALVASVAAANGAHMQRYCTPAERVVTTAFHSSAVPPIPLADYGHRIAKYTNQPLAVAVAAVALMLRYQSACPRAEYALVPTNVHRLLFAASLVAAKTNSDVFYSNKYYAQVGGVPEAEAHKLEASLLDALNWSVLVSKDEYDAVLRAADVAAELRREASEKRLAPQVTATRAGHVLWTCAGVGLADFAAEWQLALGAEPATARRPAVAPVVTFAELLRDEREQRAAQLVAPRVASDGHMADLVCFASLAPSSATTPSHHGSALLEIGSGTASPVGGELLSPSTVDSQRVTPSGASARATVNAGTSVPLRY